MMIVFSTVFFGMFLFAIAIASMIATGRTIAHNRRCYRRAAVKSLVKAARRNAIVRYSGRV